MATSTLKRSREEAQPQPSPSGRPSHTKKRRVTWKNKDASNPGTDLPTQPEPRLEKVQKDLVTTAPPPPEEVVVQIATGSYERVLHGLTVRIPAQLLDAEQALQPSNGDIDDEDDSKPQASFSDTFLFAAHTSSIRCLALSPPTESHKRYLATGSTDERINLYSLSTLAAPPPKPNTATPTTPSKPSLLNSLPSSNPLNRTLGSLTHHARPLSTLHFPTPSKLFSAAEDNTISITRSRDWTLLSSIKAPIPKTTHRPSGDTAAPGDVPAGVNAFAIHPSQKVMLSVHRGERCMRLWNLMTGKKAGVLSFPREVLAQVGEGKHALGEGRKVAWSADGEAFVVGFERGAVVFGVDSRPRGVVRTAGTKAHQMRFLPRRGEEEEGEGDLLAISTEDGRVLFYDVSASADSNGDAVDSELPVIPCLAQLGGRAAGIVDRIKDFEVLDLPTDYLLSNAPLLIATGNSDGAVRLWTLFRSELAQASQLQSSPVEADGTLTSSEQQSPAQVGRMIGVVETGRRITCLGAFVMEASHTDATNGDGVTEVDGNDEQEEIGMDSDEGEEADGAEEEFEGFAEA